MSWKPPYWDEKANRMIGKRVLVCTTYLRGEQVIEQTQYLGTIEGADRGAGFAVRRADTGEWEWLPPDIRAFEEAEPGEYTLASTGEVILDPDLISTWISEREG